MPFVAIPQTIRAVLRFQQFTDERQSVLHFKKDSGAITLQDLVDVCLNLEDWWNTVGKNAADNSLALFEVVATDISVPNGAQNSQPISPPVAGSNVGKATAGNVTATQSWRTGKTGRSYRGRTYFPGFYEQGLNEDGTLTSDLVSKLAVAGANLLFGNVVPGIFLAVASKKLALSTLIERVIVENVVDSMRRRLPKRGI